MKRGLVASPELWRCSSFRDYSLGEKGKVKIGNWTCRFESNLAHPFANSAKKWGTLRVLGTKKPKKDGPPALNEDTVKMTNGHRTGKEPLDGKRKNSIWMWLGLGSLVLICVLIAGFEYMVWSFNRLSGDFRVAARPAFLALKTCEGDADKPGDLSDTCIKNAQEQLTIARSRAQTLSDRGIYVSLEWYENAIAKSHHDCEAGDTSPEARARREEMLRRGALLAERLDH